MSTGTNALDSFKNYDGNGHVVVGNGNSLSISHIGSSKTSDHVHLSNVLVVPHLTKNLISVSKLTFDYPVDVLFYNNSFAIQK